MNERHDRDHQHLHVTLDIGTGVHALMRIFNDYFFTLNRKVDRIMATMEQLVSDLSGARADIVSLNTQMQKIGQETGTMVSKATAAEARVAELEAIIAAGGQTTPEVDALVAGLKEDLAALKVSSQAADDLVPDAA